MKISKELYDELQSLVSSIHDEQGRELPNPVPKAIPAGIKRPPTLREQIRRILRTELSKQAEDQGMESWEEANDFDVDEPELPTSRYEVMVDEVPVPPPSLKTNRSEASPGGEAPEAGEAGPRAEGPPTQLSIDGDEK